MTKSKLQALHVIRIKAGGIGNPPSLIAAFWNIGILHQEHATCTKHFDVQCTFLFSFELNVTWGKLFVVSLWPPTKGNMEKARYHLTPHIFQLFNFTESIVYPRLL